MKNNYLNFSNQTFFILILGISFTIFLLPTQAEAVGSQFDFIISNIVYQSSITGYGANVGYTVTATSSGNPVTPTCTPASGSVFPVGNTPIYCSATFNQKTGSTSFIITVSGTDSTPPIITPPPDVFVKQTGPNTTVNLGTPSVNDDVDPSPLVINSHPSSQFPPGQTIVTWTAIDHSANLNTATQKVLISPICFPPTNNIEWTITSSCILDTSAVVLNNVIIQNNSILTIPAGVTLDINFSSFNLTIKSGSSVIIQSGGKLS